MKVAPIFISPKKYNLNTDYSSNKATHTPSFLGDVFSGCSILDNTLQELKNTVDTILVPFVNDYKERYNKIGKIGVDLQVLVDVCKEQSDGFYKHGIGIDKKSKIFNAVKKEIKDYEQYIKNRTDFVHMSEMGQNPIYKNSEIQKEIFKASSLYLSDDIFVEEKKLFGVYKNCADNLLNTTMNISLENSEPELYEKIKLLNSLYYETVAMIMLLPVNDAMHIISETNELLKSQEKGYVRLEKAEKLLNNIYTSSILKNIEETKENVAEVDKFLYKNKDYESKIPSVMQIKTAFRNLSLKQDLAVEKAEKDLNNYYSTQYKKSYDKEGVYSILSAQKKANETIWALIEKSRQEYISKQNECFYD